MKLKIVCPNCDEQQEIEISEDEICGKMFSCCKCKTPADIYDADTGEKMELSVQYMPAVAVYDEKSNLQVIVPVGLCKDDVIKSLKAITAAIESNEVVEDIVMAEVAIAMEADRMIVMKACLPATENP